MNLPEYAAPKTFGEAMACPDATTRCEHLVCACALIVGCLARALKRVAMRSTMALLFVFNKSAIAETVQSPADNTNYTTIAVVIEGQGKVTPDYNGRTLKVGSFIVPKIKIAPGWIWAGWTDNRGNDTHFNHSILVEPGLVLTEHFVPNPFPAIAGGYVGLVYETNGLQHSRAGYFSLKVTSTGRYSGKMILGGHAYSAVGNSILIGASQVSPEGRVVMWLYRGDVYDKTFHHVLTADFQFDLTNGTDQVLGTVSDAHLEHGDWIPATWEAQMAGDRAVFNARTDPAPQAGIYTIALVDQGTPPLPSGSAKVTVDKDGRVRLSGTLPDGTRFTQSSLISRNGSWPCFAKLYGGNGSVLGWLTFSNSPNPRITGTLFWTRPQLESLIGVEPGSGVEALAASHQMPSLTD